jgi:hypothetical protein
MLPGFQWSAPAASIGQAVATPPIPSLIALTPRNIIPCEHAVSAKLAIVTTKNANPATRFMLPSPLVFLLSFLVCSTRRDPNRRKDNNFHIEYARVGEKKKNAAFAISSKKWGPAGRRIRNPCAVSVNANSLSPRPKLT